MSKEVTKALVDIPSIIDRVLALKEHGLRVSGIELVTYFSPELPMVYADGHQLEQVFLNILTNAAQAMEEAGHGGRLTVVAQKEPQAVRVSFYDTGPGISASNLEDIFKPFFTTKAPGQGTGLGQSICKSLVTEQWGKIWAESEPGKGAVFHVEIPTGQNLDDLLAHRVVFITGDTRNLQERDFVAATGNPLLEKPFDLNSLQHQLQSLFQDDD